MTHTFLSQLFEIFMIVMVYVNLIFLKKNFWPKMANFHFWQALEAYNVIFRLSCHWHFCSQFNKQSKKYFFNFFEFIFLWWKNQLEKKGKAKKIFLKVDPMVMWKTKSWLSNMVFILLKVVRSSFMNIQRRGWYNPT